MERNTIRVSTELYPVGVKSWNKIHSFPFHYYRLNPSSDVLKRVGGLSQVYSYVASNFPHVIRQAAIIYDGDGLEIISPFSATAGEIYSQESLDQGRIGIVESKEPTPLDFRRPSHYQAFLLSLIHI